MRLYLVVLFGTSFSVFSFSLTPYVGFHAVDKQLPFPSLKECPHHCFLCISKLAKHTILYFSAQAANCLLLLCLDSAPTWMPLALFSPVIIQYSASFTASVFGRDGSLKLTEHFLIKIIFQVMIGLGHRA